MRKLEVKATEEMHEGLEYFAMEYGSTKSAVVRAAIVLGLKQLAEQVGDTGLSTESWIAALNGKVK